MELLHATYIGYHGDAREWLDDNPDLTVELLNRCGYWYFLHQVKVPRVWRADSSVPVAMTWENRGVAPAYEPFQLQLRLVGPEQAEFKMALATLSGCRCRSEKRTINSIGLPFPSNFPPANIRSS